MKKPDKKINKKINKERKMGDWSWNPQPTWIPKYLNSRITLQINKNVCIAPEAKINPWALTSFGESDFSIKLNIFKDKTGKTHGIKFKISPPINANKRAVKKDISLINHKYKNFSFI